jgi:hypothetical protein
MEDRKISLEYKTTEGEYLAASRLYLLSSPSTLTRLTTLLVLVLAVALLFSFLFTDFPAWAMLSLALLLEAALLYNILYRVPLQFFRGDEKFRDKYHLTFSDEGISVKTRQIDSKLAWSLYSKVIEGTNLYLLIYGKDTRMMTMVPKRAFQNRVEEKRFRKMVSEHIGETAKLRLIKEADDSESEYTPSSLNPPDWR